MPHTSLKILIADDHNLFAEGLCSLLEDVEKISVCGIAKNGIELLEKFGGCRPDVALVDLNMPRLNGIDATKRLLTHFPDAKIIILSMYDNSELIQQMYDAGAFGYLVKGCDFKVLVAALRKVRSGEKVFGKPMPGSEAEQVFSDDFLNAYYLTPREIEVLKMIAAGLTNDEIAGKLYVSSFTVVTHRKNLMNKMQARNTAELVSKSLRQGLI